MPGTSPDPHSTAALAIEEAYALALEGRRSDALRMLDAAEALEGRTARIDIARARCAPCDALPGDRADAGLESLASEPGPSRGRARLTLARRLHRAGDTSSAARLVRAEVGALREAGTDRGGPLATLLALEADHLRRTPEAEGSSDGGSFRARDLLALLDLGRRLGGMTDPREVVRALLHEAIRLTGADRGFVVLTGRSDDAPLDYAAAENFDCSPVDDPSLEVSRSLIRQVAREDRIELIRLAELPRSHPASRSLGVLGVRAVACIPLRGEKHTLGVMYLDARDNPVMTESARRPFVELFAAQAAAAIENAQARRETALALERVEETIRRHNSESELRVAYDDVIGASEAMQAVYRRLDRFIPTSEPVILQGETGTGKELVARLIHARGPRKSGEFVAINCAGIAETLLEGELFGHERGAFTGADRTRAGLLEVADGGTLFLDEIADMPSRMQGDLLRVLQSGEVRRLGGRETIHVDVRIIAASNRDLGREVDRGRFRSDLFYRLNVLRLELPPLRERVEDVPLLVDRLMPRIVSGRPAPGFTQRAMARLASFSWPGNVRQLQNVLRRVAVAGLDVIDVGDLPVELTGPPLAAPAGTLKQAEDEAIRRAMKEARGNKSRAARRLGIDRKTLYAKLRRLELH